MTTRLLGSNLARPAPGSAKHTAAPLARARVGPAALCVATWCIAELLLLAFRPGYPFTQLDLLDTWFYASFQWDLPRQMQEFGGSYYAARVSLYLPGTLLHAWLSADIAAIAYKLLFSAGTTLAWAFICHRAAGVRAAFVISAFGPLVPWFVIIRHNDYMDLGVVLYGSLAAAALVGAAGGRQPAAWRFAAGAAFAAMLVANLSAVASVGFGLVAFYFFAASESWPDRLRSGAQAALGGAAMLALCGVASWLAGGPAWVLGPQIAALLHIGALAKNPWAPEDWSWLPTASWLVIPAAALVWGGLSLRDARVRSEPRFRLFRALLGAHAVACAGALVIELRGTGVLYHWFYAAFHFALGVPLLVLCAHATERVASIRAAAAWAGVFALLLVAGSVGAWMTAAHAWLRLPLTGGLLGAAAALLGVLTLGLIRAPRASDGVLVLVLLGSVPAGFNHATAYDGLRERYLLVHDAFAELNRRFPADSYRLWVDDTQRSFGRALAGAKLHDFRLLTERFFPELEPDRLTDLPVIVPTPPGAAASYLAAAQARHPELQFSQLGVVPVRTASGLGTDLLCVSVRQKILDPENPPAGTPALVPLFDAQSEAGDYAGKMAYIHYGAGAATALTGEFGAVRFRRTDVRDHFASSFIALPPGHGRQVVLVVEAAQNTAGICTIQTENYATLGDIHLKNGGRLLRRIKIPDEAGSLRVMFQSTTDASVPLPRRIAVFLLPQP